MNSNRTYFNWKHLEDYILNMKTAPPFLIVIESFLYLYKVRYCKFIYESWTLICLLLYLVYLNILFYYIYYQSFQHSYTLMYTIVLINIIIIMVL